MLRHGTPSTPKGFGGYIKFQGSVLEQLPPPERMRSCQDEWRDNQAELHRRLRSLERGPSLQKIRGGIKLPAVPQFKAAERFANGNEIGGVPIAFVDEFFLQYLLPVEERGVRDAEVRVDRIVSQNVVSALTMVADIGECYAVLHLCHIWNFLVLHDGTRRNTWPMEKRYPYVFCTKIAMMGLCTVEIKVEDCGLIIKSRPVGGGSPYTSARVVSSEHERR